MGIRVVPQPNQILIVFALLIIHTRWSQPVEATSPQELLTRGFKATPNPSISSFQDFLADSSGNYSLGFLRVNKTRLALAILHVPSSETLWQANMTSLPRWSNPTQLFFNGSLVLSDPHTGVFWSTYTDGDRVSLSNSSNLQILDDKENVVLWKSFDYPTDTLVENQNFTTDMLLVSSNGLYSLRLGSDFMGLYADDQFRPRAYPTQIYWKHKALEAKAEIIPSEGPIYAVLKSDGFLGMYQNGSTPPVDVQSFNSYQQPVSGVRRLRLEPDGNLKGYFWTGSSWILDYEAITDACDLPSSCGSYGLCSPGKGCSCLDNQMDYDSNSGHCVSPGNQQFGDFCGAFSNIKKHKTLRRTGIELPYKELMSYQQMTSLEQCVGACERNCTCWGAVYSNSSGFCYTLDYPIGTLVGVGDETKVGYFKVREGVAKGKMNVGLGVGIGVFCGVMLVFGGIVGLWWCRYRNRNRRRGFSGYVDDDGGGVVGPYKDLGAASFRSIELSER